MFTENHPVTGWDIYVLDLSGTLEVRELIVTPFDEHTPEVSPEGRWLAYVSNRTGRNQVFVRPFLGDGPDVPVSVDGGTEPRWAPQTSELFFRDGTRMMVTRVLPDQEFLPGEPEELFDVAYGTTDATNYDVFPNGQRFVMIETDPQGDGRRIDVVLNWFSELQARVPTGR